MELLDLDIREGWKRLEGWVFTERLGRREYARVVVLTLVVGLVIILVPFFLIYLLPDFKSDFFELPIKAVGIATALIAIFVYSAANVARLRDMGRPTGLFLLGLIPYVNVIFFLVLTLTKGKRARTSHTRAAHAPATRTRKR